MKGRNHSSVSRNHWRLIEKVVISYHINMSYYLYITSSIARIFHINILVANGNLFRKQPSYNLMKFEVNNKSFLNVIHFFKNMQIMKKWRFLLLQNTVLYKHSFFLANDEKLWLLNSSNVQINQFSFSRMSSY